MTDRRALRFTGAWREQGPVERDALLRRVAQNGSELGEIVKLIVAEVRVRGDDALREMARTYDNVDLEQLEVPRPALDRALETLDRDLRDAMERAARNIERVHCAFAPEAGVVTPEPGVTIGRRPDPLDRVGIYAPGGRASYPSSVLMTAVPARVAGVRELVVASPPERTGLPGETVLAAAAMSGVDRVFALGGAGAVAAMAYGTESVPRVDRIVGPGNAYVAAAKLLVTPDVGIDLPAGPSELLVVVDETSDLELVATEMVAQAEHDPLACCVALVIGDPRPVNDALLARARDAQRADVVLAALKGQGGVLTVADRAEAIAAANEYAPEHLLLAVDSAAELLPLVRSAGSVFVGPSASVSFGDYMTGANHVLPTGGAARWCSGLSPLDFVRWTTYQIIEPAAAQALAGDVARFAESEQLYGHADAARRWSGGA